MAESMTNIFAVPLLVLASTIPITVCAEAFSDPTRPPGGLGEEVSVSSPTAYPKVKGLQSVIISPAQCAAIIDGKTIELGTMHGNERLVEVNERGVVLQGTHGRNRVMALFPAVEMSLTEVAATGKQLVKCTAEQIKNAKNPDNLTGSKEKK